VSRPHPGEPAGPAAGNRLRLRKLVLSIVGVLVLVGAGVIAWKLWTETEQRSRYAEYDKQLKVADQARVAEIIVTVRRELKDTPDLAEAHATLGKALAYAGKYSDAAVELREAAKRDPEGVEVRVYLADVCVRLDLIDEAVKVLKEALPHASEDDAPAIGLKLGHIYTERYRGSAKEEDFRAARIYFQDARRHAATEAEAMDGYAGLFLTKGPDQDFDKGIAAYHELIAKHPEYPAAPKIRELLDMVDRNSAETPPPDPKEPPKEGDAKKSGDG
jgi:tetratricopeptide (TPR) repeat protein